MPDHLPGPWEAVGAEVWSRRPAIDRRICVSESHDLLADGTAGPTDCANARLIAAAPDLLEAVSEPVCPPMGEIADIVRNAGYPEWADQLDEHARRVDAAIAKVSRERRVA